MTAEYNAQWTSAQADGAHRREARGRSRPELKSQAKSPAPPTWIINLRRKVGHAFSLPKFCRGPLCIAAPAAEYNAQWTHAPAGQGREARSSSCPESKSQAKAPAPPSWITSLGRKVGQAFSLPDFCHGREVEA